MAGNLVEDPKTEECSYFVLKPLKLLLFTVIYDPFLGSFGDDFLSSCIKGATIEYVRHSKVFF